MPHQEYQIKKLLQLNNNYFYAKINKQVTKISKLTVHNYFSIFNFSGCYRQLLNFVSQMQNLQYSDFASNNMHSALVPHRSKQQMRTKLYTSLSNHNKYKNTSFEINCSNGNHYMIDSNSQQYFTAILLNEDFTQVISSIQLEIPDSIIAVNCIEKESKTLFIIATNTEIILKVLEQTEIQGKTILTVTSSSKLSMTDNDELLTISQAIRLSEFDLMIGYSKYNEYYIIIAVQSNKGYHRLQLHKLNNLDQNKDFINWFKFKKIVTYKSVKLLPLHIDNRQNFIRLFSVRDNQVELSIIQLQLQTHSSSIRLIDRADAISKIITSSSNLKQVLLMNNHQNQPKQAEILIAYEVVKDYLIIIKVMTDFSRQNIFKINVIVQSIDSNQFIMTEYQNNLFYIHNHHDKYIMNRITDIQSIKLQFNQQTILQSTNPIYIHHHLQQLYLISKQLIYCIDSDSSPAITGTYSKWLHFKQNMSWYYEQKVESCLMGNDYESAAGLLDERVNRMSQWFKIKIKNIGYQDFQIKQLLSFDIICSCIMSSILKNKHIGKLLQVEHLKQLIIQSSYKCQLEGVQILLFELQQNQQHQLIVNYILKDLCMLSVIQICQEAIRLIFCDLIVKMLHYFRTNNKHQISQLYKNIINYSLKFMDVSTDQLQHICSNNQKHFVKTIIINHQLDSLFVHFFTSNIGFTTVQLKQFAGQLLHQNQARFMKFIIHLLTECKIKHKLDNKFMMTHLDVIVEGLMNYYNHFEIELNTIFPGLSFFFLLMSKERMEGALLIGELATKCTKLSNTKIMLASILDQSKIQNCDLLKGMIDLKRREELVKSRQQKKYKQNQANQPQNSQSFNESNQRKRSKKLKLN